MVIPSAYSSLWHCGRADSSGNQRTVPAVGTYASGLLACDPAQSAASRSRYWCTAGAILARRMPRITCCRGSWSDAEEIRY